MLGYMEMSFGETVEEFGLRVPMAETEGSVQCEICGMLNMAALVSIDACHAQTPVILYAFAQI